MSASLEEESQTEPTATDHPPIDPVAFTIADRTAVSRQRAQGTTARPFGEFDSPTHLPVLEAVADELGIDIDLEHMIHENRNIGGSDSADATNLIGLMPDGFEPTEQTVLIGNHSWIGE